MKKILLMSLVFMVSCTKPNNTTITPTTIRQYPNVDSIKAIDLSKFMPVRNMTGYRSYIDSISISDTVYHPSHIDTLWQVQSDSYATNDYYNVPTRDSVTVKFYITIAGQTKPIRVEVFPPNGEQGFSSTEALKFSGKDSATFTMSISNGYQIDLVHL